MSLSKSENKGIEIDAEDYEILKSVLKKYPYKFYAYGSRVKCKARRYSDLDIYCEDKMGDEDMMNLKWDLEESDMTIKVDVIDASICSKEFVKMIKEDLVEINY
jgi:predicted nucleotidyltransferase